MKRFAAVATVLLVLLACAATAASAADGLSGTFTTTIHGGGGLAGSWSIKFSHGKYRVIKNGRTVVRGKYTVSGPKLNMKDTSGVLACKPTGRYRYSLSGRTLKFRNTGDRSIGCLGRATVLSHVFTKAK